MTQLQLRLSIAVAIASSASGVACSRSGLNTGDRTCTRGGSAVDVGKSVPSGDGCNICVCQPDGTFACTQRDCSPDGGQDGVIRGCVANGTTYAIGQSFASDCNTCTCTESGIACTMIFCPLVTGGAGGAGGSRGSGGSTGMGGSTSTPGCQSEGRTYTVGETFKRDCNTCTCTVTGAMCTAMACLSDAGPRTVDAAQRCTDGKQTYAIGETFSIDCNTCTCTTHGFACTGRICYLDARPDSPTVSDTAFACTLSSNLTFGYDGGNALYWDVNRLTASSFTVTRNYNQRASRDGGAIVACSPKLPVCGVPDAVTIATINADLADPNVRGLWDLPQNPAPIFGMDDRLVDGAVYSIALDDGHKLFVGPQCASPAMSSCRYVPAGLVKLADDLKSLAKAMLADPACQGL